MRFELLSDTFGAVVLGLLIIMDTFFPGLHDQLNGSQFLIRLFRIRMLLTSRRLILD